MPARTDTLQWWQKRARALVRMLPSKPSDPQVLLELARALGRCKVMGGPLEVPFGPTQALAVVPGFTKELHSLREAALDVPWFCQVWPERAPEWGRVLLSRRLDVLALFTVVEDAMECAKGRTARALDRATDGLIDALTDADRALREEALPALARFGIDEVRREHAGCLAAHWARTQWWLPRN